MSEVTLKISTDASNLATQARKLILKLTHQAKASHVGSALSVVDILSVLYSGVANIDFKNINSSSRDVVILSKGHAASALYSVLAMKGFLELSDLESYCLDGGKLGGHVTSHGNSGVELSTGSLGHGLPYGLGIALSQKLHNHSSRVFVVISDGECDEGTTWESALMANQFKLNNLVVIIDRNNLQSIQNTESTIALEPLKEKWTSFNWEVRKVDGHSFEDLQASMAPSHKPLCIIAETIKGKGVSFMEGNNLWHYRPPSLDDLAIALSELDSL